MSQMKHFEFYSTATGEVHSVQLHTQEYVDEANKILREMGSPMRYIPLREGCSKCGAEIRQECVCN